LRQAFDSSGGVAKIEVYKGCMHGWCVKDMPVSPDGKPIYNEPQAERAWNELVSLFKRALV
jgi:carboxymethylenebutenolidase